MRHGDDVLRRVLSIGIGGDDHRDIGELAEDGVDAALERRALAEIDGVADDANLRVRRCFVEARAKPEAAAVIDHEDALDAEANEVGNKAGEIRARFVSGDEHHEVRVRHARGSLTPEGWEGLCGW